MINDNANCDKFWVYSLINDVNEIISVEDSINFFMWIYFICQVLNWVLIWWEFYLAGNFFARYLLLKRLAIYQPLLIRVNVEEKKDLL